jgi:hypothetical protein
LFISTRVSSALAVLDKTRKNTAEKTGISFIFIAFLRFLSSFKCHVDSHLAFMKLHDNGGFLKSALNQLRSTKSNYGRFFRQCTDLTMSTGRTFGRNLDKAVKGRKNAALAAFYKALSTGNVDKRKEID